MSDRRDAEDGAWGLGRSRVGMSEASDLIDVVLIPSNVYRYRVLRPFETPLSESTIAPDARGLIVQDL